MMMLLSKEKINFEQCVKQFFSGYNAEFILCRNKHVQDLKNR